ncbi:MAG: hypothetical protein AB7O62_26665 [Pirellulales bacterium]
MILSLVLAACAALADDSAPAKESDEMKSQVRQLARQLDAAELSQREAAEQKLIELGPDVLDLLPPITPRTSAEVKERLARVRDKLQRQEAEAIVQPRRVTLDMADAPLSKVLESIQQQTGNNLVSYREQLGQEAADPHLTIKLDDVPFWQAFDQTLDAAEASVYNYADDVTDALAVAGRPEGELARRDRALSYSGPFCIEATRMESQVDLRSPRNRVLQIELDLAWEPRLKPIHVELPLSKLEVVDETGAELAVSDNEASLDATVIPGTSSTQFNLALDLPRRSVQRIERLKGQFQALLPGRVETFKFDDFKKSNQERRQGAVVVTLQSVRRNNDVWEFRVLVKFDDAAGSLQSHFGWVHNNPAYLVGKDGQERQPDGTETTRQTEDEAGMSYLFGLDGKLSDYEFVYKTPTVIVPLPVDFELKELELP